MATAVRRVVLLLAVYPVCCASDVLAGSTMMYGAIGSNSFSIPDSDLFVIDPTTGSVVQNIGNLGVAVTGLAIHPQSQLLYGATSGVLPIPSLESQLIQIDRNTAAVTFIGSFGPFFVAGGMVNIAFDPNTGALYGWSSGSNDLFTVDLATGAATLVGEAGLVGTGSGGVAINSSGDLYYSGSNITFAPINIVNKSTGSIESTLALSNPMQLTAMAFDPDDVLYASRFAFGTFTTQRTLLTIDTTTGNVTAIGPTLDNLSAFAFFDVIPAPEPSTLALATLGLLSLGMTRRRRRLCRQTNQSNRQQRFTRTHIVGTCSPIRSAV